MGGINGDQMRDIERRTIRWFIEDALPFLSGRVLDFGCGKQPYRDVIEGGGLEYHGYDRPGFPASTVTEPVGDATEPWRMPSAFDAILCTQVMQYVLDPPDLIRAFHFLVKPGGHLVLTYPTTWPEVEPEDLWRFTHAGVEEMLANRFTPIRHEARAVMLAPGFDLTIGYGLLAQRLP